MARMRDRLDAPVLCGVGAAFDFHAGPHLAGAARGCRSAGSSGSTGSRRSRAGCCRATCCYNPRFVLGVRAPVPARAPQRLARLPRHAHDVAVIGLGRVGLPLALSFADRGLRRDRRRRDAERARRRRGAAGCRSRRPAPGAARARARRAAGSSSPSASQDAAAGRPHRAHARHARATRTSRSTCRTSAACSTTCCRCCARATRWSCARPSRPGTTEWVAGYLEQQRGFAVGEDLFVAHVPERIAENHFLEEIATLPCIVGGVGEGSGARAAELFEVFGTEIVQTTPVQAELAKIWTNILRYAHVRAAQPADDGLRAVRRERLRGDRPDQPRLPARRDRARPGSPPAPACARTSPSPRSARARPACCWPSRACTRRVPLFLVEGLKRGSADRCATARSPCSASPSSATPTTCATRSRTSSIRLLERELADVAAPRPARARRVRAARRGARRAPTPSWSPPTTPAFEEPARAPAATARCSWTRGTCSAPAQVFALRARVAALRASEPRPRHRRRRHDRRGGRAPAAARRRLRGARLRPARGARAGCARAARSTPATCASSTRRARRSAAART